MIFQMMLLIYSDREMDSLGPFTRDLFMFGLNWCLFWNL